MPDVFDFYYKWLAIPPAEQPPHHYRLLGLNLFEADRDVISNASDRTMAHVRSFQTGPHAADSQRLLNELSAACGCLLSADKKAAYDRELKKRLTAAHSTGAQPPRALAMARPLHAVPLAQTALPVVRVTEGAELDFDPLAEEGAPRRKRRQRPRQQSFAVLGTMAVLVVLGLVVVLSVWRRTEQAEAPQAAHNLATSRPEGAPREPSATGRAARETADDWSSRRPAVESPRTATDAEEYSSTDDPPATGRENSPQDDMATSAPPAGEPEPADSDQGNRQSPMAADARSPLPEPAALEAATAAVQDLFKSDVATAKKSNEKIALGEKLLKMIADSTQPAERYALAVEAKRLAIAGGSPGLALEAVDALAGEFAVDRLELLVAACEELSSKETKPAQRQELAKICLPLVDEAAAAGRFKIARQLGFVGLNAARKTNQRDLVKTMSGRAKELAMLEKLTQAADDARKLLAVSDDDGAAHLALGNYLCFVAGDWSAGLPHLARSNDENLRHLAQRELAQTDAPADALATGDGWWDQSERETSWGRLQTRSRAAYWYRRQLGQLAGLSKNKVELRLAEIGDESAGSLLASVHGRSVLEGPPSVTRRDNGGSRSNVAKGEPKLEIVSARYGVGDQWVDMTDRLRALVHGPSLISSVLYYHDTDPMPGVIKSLQVKYRFNGKLAEASFYDREIVALGAAARPPSIGSQGLVITEARFGGGLRWADATRQLQEKVVNGRLSGVVDGFALPDPWLGVSKSVVIRYFRGGVEQVAHFPDREAFGLAAPGDLKSRTEPARLRVFYNHHAVERRGRFGNPLKIGGQSFERGLNCHAESRVVVFFDGSAESFSAQIGVDSNFQTVGGRGSVVFTVAANGKTLYESPVLREAMAPLKIDVPLRGAKQVTLSVNCAGDDINYDQADWADAQFALADGTRAWLDDIPDEPSPPVAWCRVVEVPPRDRVEVAVMHNGRNAKPLRMANRSFTRGLYSHANSVVVVHLPSPAKEFVALVGLDDNEQTVAGNGHGSVVFSVMVEDKSLYKSPVMRRESVPEQIKVALHGARELRLVVSDAGDDIGCDQGDWADARFTLQNGSEFWLGDLPEQQ